MATRGWMAPACAMANLLCSFAAQMHHACTPQRLSWPITKEAPPTNQQASKRPPRVGGARRRLKTCRSRQQEGHSHRQQEAQSCRGADRREALARTRRETRQTRKVPKGASGRGLHHGVARLQQLHQGPDGAVLRHEHLPPTPPIPRQANRTCRTSARRAVTRSWGAKRRQQQASLRQARRHARARARGEQYESAPTWRAIRVEGRRLVRGTVECAPRAPHHAPRITRPAAPAPGLAHKQAAGRNLGARVEGHGLQLHGGICLLVGICPQDPHRISHRCALH
jgi:hypothetical protein